MSNVVQLRKVVHQSAQDRNAHLIEAFARGRRPRDDVFWLKENAELLGILNATHTGLDAATLDPFAAFYDQIDARLRFFPQYYRFLLSLCLDLEDLGMDGDKGQALCSWVAHQGLIEGELSDLQRGEARRLLARRGIVTDEDAALDHRLRTFIERNETFAMPNKKAAYELAHIVFYLSDYGQRDPGLSAAALVSLEYAGLLAYLDQNADLLAEICTALRFAGVTPSALWEDLVAAYHQQIKIEARGEGAVSDAYHGYLVTGWLMKTAGRAGFEAHVPAGATTFTAPRQTQPGALRTLSECMFDLGELRSSDWEKMRGHVLPYLGAEGQQILQAAEESTAVFEGFFAGFARA